ncbi:hypothetical protein GGI1_08908, partial [Acidithiobacillus sp. GGI-221]
EVLAYHRADETKLLQVHGLLLTQAGWPALR